MRTARGAYFRDLGRTTVKAAVAGLWSVGFAVTCLWTTDYPLEHWVTVSLVFTLCFAVWMALSVYLCGIALKIVVQSIRRSIENNGLNPDEVLERGKREPRHEQVVRVTLAVMALSLLGVSWGLASTTLVWSLPLTRFPPLSYLIEWSGLGVFGLGSGVLVGMFWGMLSARQQAKFPTKAPRALSLPSRVGALRWATFL